MTAIQAYADLSFQVPELIDAVGAGRSHRWGCPVIVKSRPEYLAYSCGRCGTVGITGTDELIANIRPWCEIGGEAGTPMPRCRDRRARVHASTQPADGITAERRHGA